MVFTVRCFKCGSGSVRLVLGGRKILHAKCEDCNSNLLKEVMEFEAGLTKPRAKRTRNNTVNMNSVEEETWVANEEDTEAI